MDKVNKSVFSPQLLYDGVTFLKDFQPAAHDRMIANGLNRESLSRYLEEFCLSIPQNESAYSLIQKKEYGRKQSLAALLINYVVENKLLPKVGVTVSQHGTSRHIGRVISNPYAASELVNEYGDVVNHADLRGGVVSMEDLSYYLSKAE